MPLAQLKQRKYLIRGKTNLLILNKFEKRFITSATYKMFYRILRRGQPLGNG